MTKKEIIQGLQFTVDIFLFDPLTGEAFEKPRNDMDKTTIDACKGAIELLEQQPCEDAWIIDSLKEFLGESYSVLTSNKKEFMSWLERLRWHVVRCDELATELRNYKKQVECEDAISRQAAQEGLTHLMDSDGFRDSVGYVQKSLVRKMLDNLPSVQPKQTECEDAINREQAINAVANLFEMSEYPHPYPQGKPIRLRDIKEKLKQLPPVQPKIKVGHWVLLDECSNSGYYCSECHKKLVKEGWSGTVKKIKFCPNCGCRMVEPQKSEDKE